MPRAKAGTVETDRPEVRPGDCLDVLGRLRAGSVDLAYLDPPFNTGMRREGATGSYDDRFADVRAYVAFMRPRIEQVHRVLRPTGSILLHCDWRTTHHLRLLLDEIFGADCFVNELIWCYGLGGSSPRRFARKHDTVLFYGRTDDYHFTPPLIPATSNRMKGRSKKATDVLSIPSLNNMARERLGYPTQKPVALLRVLVEACCPPGGLVIDPFCGSGTTLEAAALAGRRSLGIDCSPHAVTTAGARLQRFEREQLTNSR